MFALCCEIKIGSVSFGSVHDVKVKRSLYDLMATATIKVPVTAVLKHAGEPPTHIETAQAIKVGDKVEIKLNYKVPLEIECEDEYYKLRFLNCVFSKKETTLKDCLNTILTGIQLGEIVGLTLKNFVVNNKPGSWVLGLLKKEYGLVAWFDINGKLHVGKANNVKGETVKYVLRENVISDDELKYQLAEDIKLKVKAVCYYKDGSKIEGELGEDGGETRTFYYYDVKDAGELKTLAQEELKRYSFDGYRGKITTFLLPYALPGMVASIEDKVYNCTVKRDDQVDYFDVRLRGLVNANLQGFAFIPRLQSTVLVCRIGKSNELFVCQFTEIDKMIFTDADLEVIIDTENIDIKKGEKITVHVDAEKLEVTNDKVKTLHEAEALTLTADSTTVKVSTGGVTVTRGGSGLKKTLEQMLDGICALTVPTAVGPSGVPINMATFQQIKADLPNYMEG